MKTLIIGLGNELYGDDGVGVHLVRQLKKEVEAGKKGSPWIKNVDFEECSLSGLSLLDMVVGYDVLLIIDTIKKANPVTGKVHILSEQDLRHIPGPSPHYVSVPQTLEIGRKLGLKVPTKIKIIAVEAKNMYNLGEGLSEEMAKAIPSITQKVKEVLKKIKKLD